MNPEFQQGPSFDNPIANIFSNVMGIGKSPKNVSEYLWNSVGSIVNNKTTLGASAAKYFANGIQDISAGISVSSKLNSTKGLLRKPLRAFLQDIDPSEVIPNLERLKRYTSLDQIIPTAPRELIGKLGLSSRDKLGRLLGKLSSHRIIGPMGEEISPAFLFDEEAKALFYGHESVGFAPIPLVEGRGAIGESLITRGYKRYAGSRLRIGNRSQAAIDVIYDTIESQATSFGSSFRSLKRLYKLGVGATSGGRKLRVSSLLNPGRIFRGGNAPFLQGSFGLREIISSRVGEVSALEKVVGSFQEASAAMNILIKSNYIPKGMNFPIENMTQTEAFDYLQGIIDKFPDRLQGELDRLGVTNYYPYLKAEDIIGTRNLSIPFVAGMSKVYGNMNPTARGMAKGLSQMRYTGPVTRGQVTRLGRRVFPRFMTSGFHSEMSSVGIENMLLKGMPLSIAVLDFNNQLSERLAIQDSGMLITPFGSKALSQQLPVGTAIFGASDLDQIGRMEEFLSLATGDSFSLAGASRKVLGKKLNYTKQDIDVALNIKYATENLSPVQKSLRSILLKKGKPHKYAGTLRAVAGQEISTVETRGDQLIMQFMTHGDMAPGAFELEVGGIRATAIAPSASSPFHNLANELGARGVHLITGSEDFLKMTPDLVFLNTFYEVVNKSKLQKHAVGLFGRTQEITAVGNGGKTLIGSSPLVDNISSAVQEARSLVKQWANSSDPLLKQAAKKISQGEKLNPERHTTLFTSQGVRGIRVFHTSGGMRADFMHDINLLRSQRLGPQKLMMLATGTRLYGFDDPRKNHIFDLIYKEFRRKTKGAFEIDSKTLRLKYGPHGSFKRMMDALTGIGLEAPKGRVVKLGPNGFIHKKTVLTRVPALADFSYSATGGVEKSLLNSTVLGNGGTFYIDLGKSVNVKIGKNERPIRYLPVPSKWLGLRKTMSGRVVIQKGHPGHEAIDIINKLEAGLSPDDIRNSIGNYASSLIRRFGRQGKNRAGIIENMMNVNIPGSFRARLAPQRGNFFNKDNFLKNIFNISIGEAELEDWLSRKSTSDPHFVENIRSRMSEGKPIHVLLTADPTQRPEHQLLVKLNIDRSIKKSRIGQLSISANPILYRIFERDTDRDAIIGYFMNAFKGASDAEFEKIMKAQEKIVKPFAAYHMYELSRRGTFESFSRKISGFFGQIGSSVAANLKAFTGQKTQAHKGYNIKRAIDSWINEVAFGEESSLIQMAIKPEASGLVSKFRESMTTEKMGLFDAAYQAVFQAGVAKGNTSPLTMLMRDLVEIRETAIPKGLSYDEVHQKGSAAVKKFLEAELISNKGKRRELFALESYLRKAGYGSDAIDLMLQDLQRGASQNAIDAQMNKLGESVLDQVSSNLGEVLGVGYAVQPAIGKTPVNLIETVRSTTKARDPISVLKKMVDYQEIDPGVMQKVTDQAALATGAANKAGFSSILENLSKNKLAVIAGAGLGTLALGGLLLGGPKPIPEADVSQPYDSSPQLLNEPNGIPIYTSRPSAMAKNKGYSGKNQYNKIAQIANNQSFVNINFNDTSRVIHPYSLEGDARRKMKSDF